MALPPQPGHKNVAKPQLESPTPPSPPVLPLQEQEKDTQEVALRGRLPPSTLPEESFLWGRCWSVVIAVQPAPSYPAPWVISLQLPRVHSPWGPVRAFSAQLSPARCYPTAPAPSTLGVNVKEEGEERAGLRSRALIPAGFQLCPEAASVGLHWTCSGWGRCRSPHAGSKA